MKHAREGNAHGDGRSGYAGSPPSRGADTGTESIAELLARLGIRLRALGGAQWPRPRSEDQMAAQLARHTAYMRMQRRAPTRWGRRP